MTEDGWLQVYDHSDYVVTFLVAEGGQMYRLLEMSDLSGSRKTYVRLQSRRH